MLMPDGTVLSADGCVPAVTIDDPSCCPPPLCGNDLCCTFVAFFNLLPSGPLWDYWKQAAISYFQHSDDPSQCPLLQDPRCPSLVLHAIYTVLKLRGVVHHALWPAFRESNPYTAVTTLDYQLARLQWEDCYNQHCRSVMLGELSPLEVWSACGPMFCEPNFPDELVCAIKRNVAIALTRANMGVIKNLCGINWVVAPLGAEIVPVYYVPPEPCIDPPDPVPLYPEQTLPCVETGPDHCNDCDPDGEDTNGCAHVAFKIQPTGDTIEGCPSGDVCETQIKPPQIPAYIDRCWMDTPAGLPARVWPGVLAAECIIRSMMPPTCPSNITRAC
jgi:hypothetical protein